MSAGRLRIGLSARILHEPPPELGFRGKTLQFLEQSIAHWLLAHDALAFMIPAIAQGADVTRASVSLGDYVRALDGLVLQGGADVSPASYGEEPLRPEWAGAACATSTKSSSSGSARLYGMLERATVNSIHHQSIKTLGRGLKVEAVCPADGVIEAVRWSRSSYAVGLQWHPEFHRSGESRLLDGSPVLLEFLEQAVRARAASTWQAPRLSLQNWRTPHGRQLACIAQIRALVESHRHDAFDRRERREALGQDLEQASASIHGRESRGPASAIHPRGPCGDRDPPHGP